MAGEHENGDVSELLQHQNAEVTNAGTAATEEHPSEGIIYSHTKIKSLTSHPALLKALATRNVNLTLLGV